MELDIAKQMLDEFIDADPLGDLNEAYDASSLDEFKAAVECAAEELATIHGRLVEIASSIGGE